MKAILAATDLSFRSDRAVERALRLGAELDVPCHVISVVDDDQPRDLVARRKGDAEKRLTRFVASVARPGQAVTTATVAGDPVVAILEQADAVNAGLVVLGLHRMRPLLDFFRETTMERVVLSALRPVLLVHDAADHPYSDILAPTGFSPACAEAVSTAMLLAPGARIRPFHAIASPVADVTGQGEASPLAAAIRTEAVMRCDAWLQDHDLRDVIPAPQILAGKLTDVMAELTAEPPDLIAAGAHLRSGYSPHVLGSFVAELIRRPPCDILLAKGRPRPSNA